MYLINYNDQITKLSPTRASYGSLTALEVVIWVQPKLYEPDGVQIS